MGALVLLSIFDSSLGSKGLKVFGRLSLTKMCFHISASGTVRVSISKENPQRPDNSNKITTKNSTITAKSHLDRSKTNMGNATDDGKLNEIEEEKNKLTKSLAGLKMLKNSTSPMGEMVGANRNDDILADTEDEYVSHDFTPITNVLERSKAAAVVLNKNNSINLYNNGGDQLAASFNESIVVPQNHTVTHMENATNLQLLPIKSPINVLSNGTKEAATLTTGNNQHVVMPSSLSEVIPDKDFGHVKIKNKTKLSEDVKHRLKLPDKIDEQAGDKIKSKKVNLTNAVDGHVKMPEKLDNRANPKKSPTSPITVQLKNITDILKGVHRQRLATYIQGMSKNEAEGDDSSNLAVEPETLNNNLNMIAKGYKSFNNSSDIEMETDANVDDDSSKVIETKLTNTTDLSKFTGKNFTDTYDYPSGDSEVKLDKHVLEGITQSKKNTSNTTTSLHVVGDSVSTNEPVRLLKNLGNDPMLSSLSHNNSTTQTTTSKRVSTGDQVTEKTNITVDGEEEESRQGALSTDQQTQENHQVKGESGVKASTLLETSPVSSSAYHNKQNEEISPSSSAFKQTQKIQPTKNQPKRVTTSDIGNSMNNSKSSLPTTSQPTDQRNTTTTNDVTSESPPTETMVQMQNTTFKIYDSNPEKPSPSVHKPGSAVSNVERAAYTSAVGEKQQQSSPLADTEKASSLPSATVSKNPSKVEKQTYNLTTVKVSNAKHQPTLTSKSKRKLFMNISLAEAMERMNPTYGAARSNMTVISSPTTPVSSKTSLPPTAPFSSKTSLPPTVPLSSKTSLSPITPFTPLSPTTSLSSSTFLLPTKHFESPVAAATSSAKTRDEMNEVSNVVNADTASLLGKNFRDSRIV